MADRLKSILNRLLEIWNKWSTKQKVAIISSVAVFIVAVVIIAVALNRPDYQVLRTCEDYQELNSVVEVLNSSNIQYKVDDNTLVVRVARTNLTNAKMAIAAADIKADGYTFQDAMNRGFTTTDTDSDRMFANYLSYKFKADLEGIDGVLNADVNVDVPGSSNSFYESTAERSISVILTINKSIDSEAAESMALFLATSAGNSTTNSITIIDSKGNTLFSGMANSSSSSGVSIAGQKKYQEQIQQTTVTAMRKSILATGLYDDMEANLNYVLDWDSVNKIVTEYSTQGGEQAIFSHSYEEMSEGTSGAGGTPGTSSNDDDTTYTISDGTGSTSTYTVKEYDYCPNSIVTTTVKSPGQIILDDSTLAVTFIKNMVYSEDECKRLGYLDNITWEQFKAENTQPVKLDVDEELIRLLSAGTGINPDKISVVAYQRPWFQENASTSIFSNISFWAQILLAIIILAILVFVVVRSARPLTVEEKEPELSVEEMLATTREQQNAVEEIDINDKSETRKAIEKFVDENPEAVALLLRNWLNEGWD